MNVVMMVQPTDYQPEQSHETRVRLRDLGGEVYLIESSEKEGFNTTGRVETWMSREQLETHIATLQAALDRLEVGTEISCREIKKEAEIQA